MTKNQIQKIKIPDNNINTHLKEDIDIIYLKQAFNIREEFENIQYLISHREKDISNLKDNIVNLKDKLSLSKKDIKLGDEYVMNGIYSILDDLENESLKLSNIIKPIEDKLEKLKNDENSLYKTLKEKYPDEKDEKLKEVIVNYISKRKRDQ